METPFTRIVNAALDRLGWTQPTLAERSGVSQGSVSRLCNGQQAPSLDVAAKIARALGLSLDELAGLRDARDTLTPQERQIVDLVRTVGVDRVWGSLFPPANAVSPASPGVPADQPSVTAHGSVKQRDIASRKRRQHGAG